MAASLLATSLVLTLFPEPGAGFVPRPPDITGWWSQYSQSPTDAMISYHNYSPGLSYIAVPDCGRIGDYALITVNDSAPQLARVFDCLGANGDPSLWGEGALIGELGYYLTRQHGVTGRGGVAGSITWIDNDKANQQPAAN